MTIWVNSKFSVLIRGACIFIFLLLFSISCRTIAPVVVVEDSYTGNQIFEQLLGNEPDIETYSVRRMQISLKENEDEISFRGSVRIKKDSLILFTINAFAGIEAARVLMTRDSIKIIDRINNQYFLGNYEDRNRYLPFNVQFDMMQNLFFATPLDIMNEYNLFENGDKVYFFNNEIISLQNHRDISTDDHSGNNSIRFDFDKNFLMRESLFHSTDTEAFARFNFNSYNKYNGYYFPEDIDVYLISHKVPVSANIKLSRIEINNELSFPFNIPARYNSINR